MTHRVVFTVGVLFLIFGIYLTWQRTTPLRLSFADMPQNSLGANKPARAILSIPTANIKLPIIPAAINNGKWEDTKLGVSHLISSPVPGAIGNSIIYGHNYPNLLGPLERVKPGDKVNIQLSDSTQKNFTVAFVTIVTPDQTHVLNNSEDSRLTIYTCTGLFDTKRLVVTAIADTPTN